MGLEFFWIFLFLLAMQPIMRQKFLELARQKMIERIEAARGSRVILLVHRQETVSFFGLPIMRYIDINDSEAVISAINMTDKDVPIDIILHTPGGLVLAALQIAMAIKKTSSQNYSLCALLCHEWRDPHRPCLR
jgi:ClpP class serine protease